MTEMVKVDAHVHLWEKQQGMVNGKPVFGIGGGRSNFGGEIRQMMPPYMNDDKNTAERLLACGVKAIWNFTNVELTEPNSNTIVENVHFSDSLLSLSYYVAERKDEKASKELKNEDE